MVKIINVRRVKGSLVTNNQKRGLILTKTSNGVVCTEAVKTENDKWITVKPHGEEKKGRHLLLEGDETPKQAMKRQWGVDIDRKKQERSEPKKVEPQTKPPAPQNPTEKQTGQYVYKEAKDKQEAENYARKVLGVKNVNYGSLDTDYCNAINSAMSENLNSFPKLKEMVNTLGSIQGLNKDRQIKYLAEKRGEIENLTYVLLKKAELVYGPSYQNYPGGRKGLEASLRKDVMNRFKKVVTQRASAGEIAHYLLSGNDSLNGMYFNESLRKKDMVDKAMSRAAASKFHPEGATTAKSMIDHEFGHALEHYIIKELKKGKISLSYTEIRHIYSGLSSKEICEGLSKYADGSLSEFIAEAYSEYRNNPNPRSIARNVGNLLQQAYKEIQ